jgi:CheY-like chemotaxis protein
MTDVLIIDDDEVYGELSQERLEGHGWDVRFHHGPFGTVNAIRSLQPRVIVLDVNMPGLDGTGISDILQKTPGLEEIRVLLHSSMDPRELERLAKLHGAHASLSKSAPASELVQRVRALMAMRVPVRR